MPPICHPAPESGDPPGHQLAILLGRSRRGGVRHPDLAGRTERRRRFRQEPGGQPAAGAAAGADQAVVAGRPKTWLSPVTWIALRTGCDGLVNVKDTPLLAAVLRAL